MQESDDINVRRRSFLSFCGSAGLGSTLFPGALWAQTDEGQAEVTVEMIDHAARLAGLSFSAADREEMLEGVRNNLLGFDELHELRIDQNVPPPLYFNPVVPGQVFDEPRQAFDVGPRPAVSRPDNLEDVAFWTVTELSQLIESRQVTSTELTKMYIDRIRRFDPVIRSVITLTEDRALALHGTGPGVFSVGQNMVRFVPARPSVQPPPSAGHAVLAESWPPH